MRENLSSLEELVKDDSLEAVFVATDAPSHARHCMERLKHGKHVACAVPAVFGLLEDAFKLQEAVKSSGRKYMMFETSAFREDCNAMRVIYRAGGFGKLIYSEGEYYHYMSRPIDSFKNWRSGFRRNGIRLIEALLHLRLRRHFHGSLLHGHAERRQALAALEQFLQERFGTEIALSSDERGRDGANRR